MDPFGQGENPAPDPALEGLAGLAELLANEPEDEDLSVEEGQVLPEDPEGKIELSPDQEQTLKAYLEGNLTAYDNSMAPRYRRWKEINNAYNLVPDSIRAGTRPDASRLVSELLRSQVNIATSRIVEMVLSMHPLIQMEVWDDQAPDGKTLDLVKTARATTDFFESYGRNELALYRWLPIAIHRSCKLGHSVMRSPWVKQRNAYRYRTSKGQFEHVEEEIGHIKVELIHNENVVLWPIYEQDLDAMPMVGHRSYMEVGEFQRWAKKKKVPEAVRKVLAEAAAPGLSMNQENRVDDLRGKDIAQVVPFENEVQVTELWLQWYYLDDDADPMNLLVFYHEDSRELLWVGHNPLNCQRHPYFDIPYWREDGVFWATGVGQEVLYPQAADTALWNMFVDNLKVVGNAMRIVRQGSEAETMMDEVGPGLTIVTGDVERDFRTVELGGDLSQITAAVQSNQLRAVKSSGITPPLEGTGDPVLKSGASPSSLQMLINEAGKKFGQVDRNMREGLSKLYAHFLELLQQYAPDGIFYELLSEESAGRVARIKYYPPSGRLRKLFRITAMAPSAATNKEVQSQRLMILYNQAQAHAQLITAMADQAMADNPAGLLQFKYDLTNFLHEMFLKLLQEHEVPGVPALAPKLTPPTPEQEIINQLMQQLQQMQEQMQQMEQQLQMAQAQGQPGMGQEGPPMDPAMMAAMGGMGGMGG